MRVYSVDITSFTASFRHPMLISGPQPTLDVPPISTILGLINAACGKYIQHSNAVIGYYFEYQGKGWDVETIYMAEVNKKGNLLATTRSNAIKREFLFEPFLRLYSTDADLIHSFREPVYDLLLGRSSDLATTHPLSIQDLDLEVLPKAEYISGQIIPYAKAPVAGKVQALAKYFTDTIPRQMLGKEPYVVIDCHRYVGCPLAVCRDNVHGKVIDIYMHQIDSSTL